MATYTAQLPQTHQRLEPGFHPIIITDASEAMSQNGNEMIKLTCQPIIDGLPDNPKMFEHLVFTPKASWKIDQVRAAIGDEVIENEEVELLPRDFVGREAIAEIHNIEREKGTFAEIKRWLLPNEAKNVTPKSDNSHVPF